MGTRRSKAALKSFLRFSGSSVVCFLLDYGLFTLLNSVLLVSLPDGTRELCATYGARIVSAVTNFFLNRLLVFQDKSAAGQSIWRYAVLAVVQASLSAVLVSVLRISQMQQTCSKRSSRSRWTACSSWQATRSRSAGSSGRVPTRRINKKIPVCPTTYGIFLCEHQHSPEICSARQSVSPAAVRPRPGIP